MRSHTETSDTFHAVGPRTDGYWIQNDIGTVAKVQISWHQPYIKDEKELAEFIAAKVSEYVKSKRLG